MSKPKIISQEVKSGKWRTALTIGSFKFLAEIHCDDGTWTYGCGDSKRDALEYAKKRIAEGNYDHSNWTNRA